MVRIELKSLDFRRLVAFVSCILIFIALYLPLSTFGGLLVSIQNGLFGIPVILSLAIAVELIRKSIYKFLIMPVIVILISGVAGFFTMYWNAVSLRQDFWFASTFASYYLGTRQEFYLVWIYLFLVGIAGLLISSYFPFEILKSKTKK